MQEIITNQQLIDLVEASAREAVQEYNIMYGTDYSINEEIIDLLLAFTIISIYGYQALVARQDIPQDIKQQVLDRFKPDYKGIENTTREQIDNLVASKGRDLLQDELDILYKNRNQTIIEGAYYGISNQLMALLAEEDGRIYVGGVTVGDLRVREQHQQHDDKYWLASRYQPWYDYNCRCTYIFFKSRKEAEQAGFTRL